MDNSKLSEFSKNLDGGIPNETDYELALKEIDLCLDAAAGSPERDRLEVLIVLVDDYEAKHYPISPPDSTPD